MEMMPASRIPEKNKTTAYQKIQALYLTGQRAESFQ
jgi:hypothetical protein